ncbi:MAG: hypothetical protein WBD37_08695, partial [Anderseniella sp.]
LSSSGSVSDMSVPSIAKVGAGRAMAGSGWMGLQSNNAYRILSIAAYPLFGSLLALAALLMLVSLMWYREGR